MQDEHFMQSWNAGHSRFSTDLDRVVGNLAHRFSRRARGTKGIGNSYGIPAETRAGPSLPLAARASLRGLAASLITATLWLVVMALATPAPGLAAMDEASMVTCACIAHLPLA